MDALFWLLAAAAFWAAFAWWMGVFTRVDARRSRTPPLRYVYRAFRSADFAQQFTAVGSDCGALDGFDGLFGVCYDDPGAVARPRHTVGALTTSTAPAATLTAPLPAGYRVASLPASASRETRLPWRNTLSIFLNIYKCLPALAPYAALGPSAHGFPLCDWYTTSGEIVSFVPLEHGDEWYLMQEGDE